LIQPWDHKSSFPELTQTAQQFIDKTPIIFSSPFDFTVARFYLGEQDRHATRIYNVDAPNEDLSNWAIVEASDQISTLPTTSHIVITPDAHRFTGYQTIAEVNQFRVLKK
jgi:hypothetical protein